MGCPAFKHDAHVQAELFHRAKNAKMKAVHEPVARPQMREDAVELANSLIHDLYGDMFKALSKV